MTRILSIICLAILSAFNVVQADLCGDLVLNYSRSMTTVVCHQTAAIVFANFEGVWEKTVALEENTLSIDKFKAEVFSEGPSTAYMGTIWQYVDNTKPFATHSFVIHRSEDRQFRLWSAFADAYSGGYSLNNWLEDMPGWGWSVFAGSKTFSQTDFNLFFDYSAIADDRNAKQDDRVTADWNIWMPDSLFGFNSSYGYYYTNDTAYEIAYYKTSAPVTDERCKANIPVVQSMKADCFANSQTCIQFLF